MINPREYQQECHDAVIKWVRDTVSSCLIEAGTAAGKSVMIAMIAHSMYEISKGKRVLCLAPTGDLIEQNSEKFALTGEPFSIYSASVSKSLRHPVIFATEGTFKRVAEQLGGQFCAVLIDEAHKITPTIQAIIEDMRKGNPYLRVIGFTATPYRTLDGYIYQIDENGRPMPAECAIDPYFTKLVYRITARQLLEGGYTTPPKIGTINAAGYDTSGLTIGKNGLFTASSIDRAFVGKGRKTSAIVADVVAQSVGARGVMLFAADVNHAKEIMESLPPELSRMIGGDINTKRAQRRALVSDYRAQKFKYLVSVGTMTTGVDFPHVDVLAILRKTESPNLLQQILGRGCRLYEGKEYYLILDYAGNIEDHCPDGDVYAPEIKAYRKGESVPLEVICPECSTKNEFSARPNPSQLEISEDGYFKDLAGNVLDIPAHFGRRCTGVVKNLSTHQYDRCGYFWTTKECPGCGHHNDIAARRCEKCRHELIDPNEKLIGEYKAAIKDPTVLQTEEVLSWDVSKPRLSTTGKNMVVTVEVMTERRLFSVYYLPEVESGAAKYQRLCKETNNLQNAPRTITYKKETSGFYDIKAFNLPTDAERLQQELGVNRDDFSKLVGSAGGQGF